MKMIEILFEKFGYTRIKDAHRTIEFYKQKYLHLVDEIFNTKNEYMIVADYTKERFIVRRIIPGAVVSIHIKEFPFGEDREYAWLCANELLEELEKDV